VVVEQVIVEVFLHLTLEELEFLVKVMLVVMDSLVLELVQEAEQVVDQAEQVEMVKEIIVHQVHFIMMLEEMVEQEQIYLELLQG
jgi:5,10-methylenetetrahydrofolate reductase